MSKRALRTLELTFSCPPCWSADGYGQTVRFGRHSPEAGSNRGLFLGGPLGGTTRETPERMYNLMVTSPLPGNCDPAAPCETPQAPDADRGDPDRASRRFRNAFGGTSEQ